MRRDSTRQAGDHAAYGSGESFPTNLPSGELQLVKHNGGAGSNDGTDVMYRQQANGEIQLKVRSNST